MIIALRKVRENWGENKKLYKTRAAKLFLAGRHQLEGDLKFLEVIRVSEIENYLRTSTSRQ
jgi:hypothetical protein